MSPEALSKFLLRELAEVKEKISYSEQRLKGVTQLNLPANGLALVLDAVNAHLKEVADIMRESEKKLDTLGLPSYLSTILEAESE